MSAAVLRSSAANDLRRFRRSTSLWLLLLSAPIAARYMISETEGEGINLAVGGQLPVLTSPVFGVWLGIVVSLLVMPVAFIYLRAGPTRRQPWQVEETTAAGRISMALGRFAANGVIMVGVLSVLCFAGLFLAWMKVTGPWEPGAIILLASVIALPTLLTVAALHVLFDAVPFLRGAFGDFLFFLLWMFALVIPAAFAETPSSYANNLASLSGAIRPLVESAPEGASAFAIGTSNLLPGRVELDAWRGIFAEGYLPARASWIALALAIAAFAGFVYRPHKPKNRRNWFRFLEQSSLGQFLPKRAPSTSAATPSHAGAFNLVATEARLIASMNLFLLLAVAAALAGFGEEYRKVGSPAALLLMVFALTAYAGQAENRSLRTLTGLTRRGSGARRAAFILAGTLLTALLAVPAAIHTASPDPLVLGVVTGAAFSTLAIGLAALSGSPFMPRIVLLIVWYGYFAS